MKAVSAIILGCTALSLSTLLCPSVDSAELATSVGACDIAAIQQALASGADPNDHDPTGLPVLFVAAKVGCTSALKSLLAAGAIVDARAPDSSTALMIAASNSHAAIVDVLVAAGASVNACNSAGDTPLIAAVSDTSLKIVKLLLAHGADVDARNTNGATALYLASTSGNVSMQDLLVGRALGLKGKVRQRGAASRKAIEAALAAEVDRVMSVGTAANIEVHLERIVKQEYGSKHLVNVYADVCLVIGGTVAHLGSVDYFKCQTTANGKWVAEMVEKGRE